MRRKIIIIGVACLMVVLASMTVNAQDQQRKVTPVKPKTNKVLTPPKGTDEKRFECFHIRSFYLLCEILLQIYTIIL